MPLPKFEGDDFEFPDEKEAKEKSKQAAAEDDFSFEIEDDTPEEDRGRKAAPPPEDPTEDELASYDEKVQSRIKKFTRGYHDERRAKEAAERERIAAENYAKAGTPLVILAGKEYGSGSSRDWAAKGTALLGVKAVIAESYERIHRSNLIGMGVIPLQFQAGQNADSLGLQGDEVFTIRGIEELNAGTTPREVAVEAVAGDGRTVEFTALVRIDTPGEADYYRHGGILQYVLRSLL